MPFLREKYGADNCEMSTQAMLVHVTTCTICGERYRVMLELANKVKEHMEADPAL